MSEHRSGTIGAQIKATARVVGLALVFFAIFLAVFVIDRQLFAREIIFYNALVCLFLVTAVLAAIWAAAALSGRSDRRGHVPIAIVLALFIGYSFAITVPALIDRSISFFMLAKAAEAGEDGVTVRSLEQDFYDEFLLANGAIPRRLEEQVVSGNLARDGDTYRLIPRGRSVYDLHQALLSIFRADLAYGTDPG